MAEEERRSAEPIIRPFFKDLRNRLDPTSLLDRFYEDNIIEMREKERIEVVLSTKGRYEAANEFLKIIVTRSWNDGLLFAEEVKRLPGQKDLGEKMLGSVAREGK